ncbi:MAG: helix-turn-helix transcriptional regulator, partial [Clostridia bacterium]|nr:helix-turn-helix transcriptional regulator [Clostridia bacterium]
MDAKSIGTLISKLRKKHGMTQSQLAEKLNISDKAVSRWENGNTYPDIELLPVIANILKITMDELMGMSDIEKENRA